MRALLIDDETRARLAVRQLVAKHCPQVEIVQESDGVLSGIKAIKKTNPELVFLDIKMRDGSGFNLLDQLDQINFHVIFITAFDEFAIKAFQYNAIHYLLKPIGVQGLVDAVNRTVHSSFKPSVDAWHKLNSDIKNRKLDCLALPTRSGFKTVVPEDVIHCQSDNYYTRFYFKDGSKFLVSRTLKFYEELLTTHGFFRVHQSYLVNLSEVVEYRRHHGGMLVLSNHQEIPVSKSKREMLFNILNYR